MDNIVAQFVQANHVDTLQKIYVLLFFHWYPERAVTSQELADYLFIGYLPLVEKILNEFQQADLIDGTEGHYKLSDKPQVRSCLQALSETLEDPLTRQEILEWISDGPLRSKESGRKIH